MNITDYIQSHEELNKLPFLMVFRIMSILSRLGALNLSEGVPDVEKT